MMEVGEVKAGLVHPDPAQLMFQIIEIIDQRSYLKHGVSVEPGDVVFDVGANVGVAAAFFAGVCDAGEVHCFEPLEETRAILAANTARFPSCHVHPFGLSDRDGTETFTYYPAADAMSGRYADRSTDEELVRTALTNRGQPPAAIERAMAGRFEPETRDCAVRSLSSVVEELGTTRIDLLKIDVERAELDVLAGIGEGDWPIIEQVVVEVHDSEGRLGVIVDQLTGRGFDVTTEQESDLIGTEVFLLYGRRITTAS